MDSPTQIRFEARPVNDEPVVLDAEQAISMLPDGDMIHTFRSSAMCLIGADWKREKLIETIRKSRCEIGGETCCQMKHGLVVWADNHALFVNVREGTDYEAFAKKVT